MNRRGDPGKWTNLRKDQLLEYRVPFETGAYGHLENVMCPVLTLKTPEWGLPGCLCVPRAPGYASAKRCQSHFR